MARSKLRARLLALVLGVLATILVAELGLRLAGVSHPVFGRADQIAGGALRAGRVRTELAGGRSATEKAPFSFTGE